MQSSSDEPQKPKRGSRMSRRTSALARKDSGDDLRACSTHSSASRRGRTSNTSGSDEKNSKSGSPKPRKTRRRSSTSEMEATTNSEAKGRHPSRRGVASKDSQKRERRPAGKVQSESRRSMRRQISQQRRESLLSTPRKERGSIRAGDGEAEPIITPEMEAKDRVLQDLAMKKLEMENQHLQEQLEHAWDIIRQLREQRLDDAIGNPPVPTTPQEVGPPEARKVKKTSFWSREKAANLVGLDSYTKKKKDKPKKDTLGIKAPWSASYSEMGDVSPDSVDSKNAGNQTRKEKIAQDVASALEKQFEMSYRRSSAAAVPSTSAEQRRAMADMHVLMREPTSDDSAKQPAKE